MDDFDFKTKYQTLVSIIAQSRLCITESKTIRNANLPIVDGFCDGNCEKCIDTAVKQLCKLRADIQKGQEEIKNA